MNKICTVLLVLFIIPELACGMSVTMTLVGAKPEAIGSVTFSDSKYGLLIQPNLHNLPVGLHGFHLHSNASCEDSGKAAGGHFDPENTKSHLGPYANGHLGDLPVLYVNETGIANLPILAPRLTVKDITGHSLMIHAQGDNYSDSPTALGGGGERIACGIIGNESRPGLQPLVTEK